MGSNVPTTSQPVATGEPEVEQPSRSVLDVARIIREAGRERKLRLVDLEALAEAIREVWPEVQLPRRPVDEGKVGWLEIERARCGDPDCACKRDPARRHPRVVHRWREGGRRRKKILGPPGRARAPADIAKPLREDIERLNKAAQMDMGFLHDD